MLVDLMAIPWVDLRAKPRVDFTATWRFVGPGEKKKGVVVNDSPALKVSETVSGALKVFPPFPA